MRPSFTCNVVRRLLKAAGSSARTDENGVCRPPMPYFSADMSHASVKADWLCYNLARKRVVSNPELRAQAIASFLQCEEHNAEFNKGTLPDWLAPYVFRAAQICADVLGQRPVLDEIYRNSVFTGGASTSRKRSMAHPALKWWARPRIDVTPLALRHLIGVWKTSEVLDVAWGMPGVLSSTTWDGEVHLYNGVPCPFNIVPGSRFDTVPKDASTDRTILIEPDGNMLLQRGVGITFAKRLRKIGIDLSSQAHNQHLAFLGSRDGDIMTVDLRNASNRITRLLCCLILPPDWYQLLLDLRSPLTKMPDGNWHVLEMISSMGNGYTFELESLIFYALTKSVLDIERCQDSRIAIFGDDIACNGSVFRPLSDVFEALGLEVNTDKSFFEGPFRESCGKHYFNGLDVTPFYIKEDAVGGELLRIVNSFHSWCTDGDYTILPGNAEHRAVLEWLVDQVPRDLRNQVPLEYSNNCGLYSPLYSKPVRRRLNKRGCVVVIFTYLRDVTGMEHRCDDELLWLYQHVERQPTSELRTCRVPGGFLLVCGDEPPRWSAKTGRQALKTVAIPSHSAPVL